MFSTMTLVARSSRLVARSTMLVATIAVPAYASGATCDSLKSLTLPDATIDSVQIVAAGTFQQPGARAGRGNAMADLPAFCRVAITSRPSSDSDIKIEVWLPADNWNGKYQAVGNNGWSGDIRYAALGDALRRGYATSSTDLGHTGGASFALGHPQKVIDFAYRATHDMTVKAKTIVNAYYGSSPKYSYFNGCSAGGRQAMKEAQAFPDDFDGIIAGSPGLDWSGRSAQAVRMAQIFEKEDARLSPAHLSLLHNAVIAACDMQDGVKDGLLANPAACTFDPAVLQCKNGDGPDCLSAAQVAAVRAIYSPLKSAGREIPGLARGSELNWTEGGWSAPARTTGVDHFRYLIFNDPNWELAKFDASTDPARLDQGESGAINARDPNLKKFFERGGKLLTYHGWNDPQITPLASVTYYQHMVAASGGTSKVSNSYRLFLAPGMNHCQGGDGPDSFDKIGTIEQWVEKGKAPEQIIASHSKGGAVDRTRPLCPYPQVATYKGSGSIDEAANFACK